MTKDTDSQLAGQAQAGPEILSAEPPVYDTVTLFGGRREIIVRHAGENYRMKITKQGKLILNK